MARAWLVRAKAVAQSQGPGGFLIRALAGTGAVRVASMAASFAVGVQLARALGTEGYGYYGIALAIITLCGIPAELGLPRLVTREVAAAEVRKDLPHMFGLLRWADVLALRLAAGVAVVLFIIAGFLSVTSSTPLAILLAIGAPVMPFMAFARLRGGALLGLHEIVRGQLPANLIRPLAQSILLFVTYLVLHELQPSTAMAINAVAACIAFLLAAHWLRLRLPKRGQIEEVKGDGRSWLASSIPMALTDGMRMLQVELTILLIALLSSPDEVGIFRVAAATAFAAATPIAVINQVAFPTIARLHAARDQAALQKTVTRLARAQFAGVFVLSLPLIAAPALLLTLVFGPEYAPAANVLRVLTLAQVVNAAFGPNVALLNMTHQERRVTRAMAIGLFVNAVGVLALTAFDGIIGASAATFASLFIWNAIAWADGKRILKLDSSIAGRVS